jgi:hypothetical protein
MRSNERKRNAAEEKREKRRKGVGESERSLVVL